MIEEFKKFIFKGNVVDLSTGVLVGAAFGGIVTAFTKGVVEPLLKAVGGKPNVSLGIPIGTFTDEALCDVERRNEPEGYRSKIPGSFQNNSRRATLQ